jgi:hypothetical protein
MTISFARHQLRDHQARRSAVYAFHAQLSRRRNLLAERGLDISYETLRLWVLKSGREENDNGNGGGKGGGVELDLDPLLIELLKKIPSTGSGWPEAQRVRWFRTFAMSVSQIYDEDENPIELDIKAAKEATN